MEGNSTHSLSQNRIGMNEVNHGAARWGRTCHAFLRKVKPCVDRTQAEGIGKGQESSTRGVTPVIWGELSDIGTRTTSKSAIPVTTDDDSSMRGKSLHDLTQEFPQLLLHVMAGNRPGGMDTEHAVVFIGQPQ
eukprot:10827254-Alexandrium_andersonii.AAC.1